MIDIDEQPHTNQIYGVRTRLRDDACDRELERLPDAKRAVYLAVDAMLKADEKGGCSTRAFAVPRSRCARGRLTNFVVLV